MSTATVNQTAIQLKDAEQQALVAELRSYADYRGCPVRYDSSERMAELSCDPTYAYDEQAIEEVLEREQAWCDELDREQVAAASPWRELADQVEQIGLLDLADDEVRSLVVEMFDHTGWELDGDESSAPPADLRRVMEWTRALGRGYAEVR